jgi:ATP-binding cassette, subfamily B, bacterial
VRWHIVALGAGFTVLAVLMVPVGLLIYDTFWTRVLQGQPLTDVEAAFFRFDPALTVHVTVISEALRREIVRRVVWWGVGVAVFLVPAVSALYYYQVWILQRINQILRVQLVDQLQALSLRFHQESRVGDALYRLYQDSAMATQLVDVLMLAPISSIARFLFGCGVVAAFDPGLALLLALVWPPTLAIGWLYSRSMRVGFRRAREANSGLTSRIQETLSGIKVIKAYGAEQREQDRFEESSRGAFAAAYRARNLFATYQVVIFWVLGTAAMAAMALGALRTREATPVWLAAAGFTAWNLGLYNFFKLRVSDTANSGRSLYRTWGRIQDIAIGLDRVFEVLDLEPEVRDAPDAVVLEGIREGVTFRDVHFRYAPDRPVLDGADLHAPIGAITAIVGPTGSGKSTLMALLLRLFDPERGAIEIDGRDLRDFRVSSVREQVSIALQENVLFGTTVRENIRYAVPQASDEAVREAARVACADEFIRELPDDYDTLLGERGTKLSTGQRQRLSIARALLKDTPVLILDEPTAALDADTELRVLGNLQEWGRGRAIFVITHRLSTIRRAHRIAVLSKGRVAEVGSHDELMAKEGGLYQTLVESEEARPEPLEAVL